MGRPKTYDRAQVTDRAMRLFWERGYHATSTRELAEAMEVNPYSLYAEFGSKEALFDAAIDRYEQIVVQHHFGKLETPTASLEEVRAVLDFFGDNGSRAGSERGCLMCNTSTERAPSVEASRLTTARFIGRVSAAFENALAHALASERLVPGAPIAGLAAFFANHLMGTFVLSRAQVDPAILRAAADQALARLDQLSTPVAPAA